MSSPRAILLVPPPGDEHGLLAPGACGATVPTAHYRACRHGHDGAWFAPHDLGVSCRHADHAPRRLAPIQIPTGDKALVLAWNGRPVPEGCDRAARVLAARDCPGSVAHGVGVTFGPACISERHALWGWEVSAAHLDESMAYAERWPAGESVEYMRLVPGLSDLRSLEPMIQARALAIVCAARLGCEVVVLDV